MQSKEYVIRNLYEAGIVPVIRIEDPGALTEVAEALREGGVNCMEITMTVPGALKVLETVSNKLAKEGFSVGMGTVLDAETARSAILAGATFIVSPILNPNMIEMCKRYSLPVIAGAMTPTETFNAWQAGADVVKVFPAGIGGPRYFNDMKGPFPQIKLMPTGGVNLETAAEFIKAGAFAVGVGGALVNPATIESGDLDTVKLNAKRFVKVVADARST
jgi:2-dehydro-3-deoxyphosphogluconate aldolase/(4S)-4-hydroxy-2-oxoglutarate aldolase